MNPLNTTRADRMVKTKALALDICVGIEFLRYDRDGTQRCSVPLLRLENPNILREIVCLSLIRRLFPEQQPSCHSMLWPVVENSRFGGFGRQVCLAGSVRREVANQRE